MRSYSYEASNMEQFDHDNNTGATETENMIWSSWYGVCNSKLRIQELES